jgi:hypothetical protein
MSLVYKLGFSKIYIKNEINSLIFQYNHKFVYSTGDLFSFLFQEWTEKKTMVSSIIFKMWTSEIYGFCYVNSKGEHGKINGFFYTPQRWTKYQCFLVL